MKQLNPMILVVVGAGLLLGAVALRWTANSSPEPASTGPAGAAEAPVTPAASSSRAESPSDATAPTPDATMADAGEVVKVYKAPTCGCCSGWADHLREAGYTVEEIETQDLASIKVAHGIDSQLQSCHTALVAGYVIEGHVPAEDVRRLLAERPDLKGLAVPGMPGGSPGMEMAPKEDYEVLAFDERGRTSVWAAH